MRPSSHRALAVLAVDLVLAHGAVPGFTRGQHDDSPAQDTPRVVGRARYVFLFIGDGMGLPQVAAAEIYAKTPSRGNMYDIAVQLADSGFDFFGGGGLVHPRGKAGDQPDAIELAKANEDSYLLYGGYEPLTVTLTHILNRKAGIGWTSYSHTGIPVPIYALGIGQEIFNGYYDNTDIFRKTAAAMGIAVGVAAPR